MGVADCPNCSSQFIKRVRRRTVYERLASLFYVYPFVCQLCGHGFKLFQPGVRYIRIDEDQREHQRLSVDLPAGLAQDKASYDAVAIDVSMRGCTIKTNAPLALGSIVRVAVQIPDEANPLTIDAAIIRNFGAGRAGLEFLRFQGSERERLRHFIHRLWANQPQESSSSKLLEHAPAAQIGPLKSR